MTTTETKGAGGYTTATNKADRMKFAAMSPEVRDAIAARSSELYDGSRTVAACWKLALAEAAA